MSKTNTSKLESFIASYEAELKEISWEIAKRFEDLDVTCVYRPQGCEDEYQVFSSVSGYDKYDTASECPVWGVKLDATYGIVIMGGNDMDYSDEGPLGETPLCEVFHGHIPNVLAAIDALFEEYAPKPKAKSKKKRK